MSDTIETIDGSVIQHGRHNDRIYLMHLRGAAHVDLIAKLDRLAREKGYGKIFAKIPATAWGAFQAAGFVREACVPGLFQGGADGLFIAKFFSPHRRTRSRPAPFDPRQLGKAKAAPPGLPALRIAAASVEDSRTMADLYRRTFASYAFPIHRPAFLRHMMKNHAVYFCARIDDRLAALAAMEIDAVNRCGEMTDFATLPEFRRMGLALRLLDRMELEAVNRGIRTAYTIARADSLGMNTVFAGRGYRYAGCLLNNTQIGGRIRSMYVWYKQMKK
jgi:putative beta-lysine N-acetyltransferase